MISRKGSRPREERELFERYRRDREPELRDALVRRFLPLVRHLASRYRHTSEPMDDLVQAGSIGLLLAIDRYDPGRGTAFSSYAVPTISGEIKRHFRDRTWSVKVPRSVRDSLPLIEATESALTGTLGRSPTPDELADELSLPLEGVLNARAAALVRWPYSLHHVGVDEEERRPGVERFAVDDPGFRAAEDAATLSRLLACLDARDREVLRLYFEEDLKQSDVAARVGLSQMHVSRLIRRAIAEVTRNAEVDEVA